MSDRAVDAVIRKAQEKVMPSVYVPKARTRTELAAIEEHPFGGDGAEEYGALWHALHRQAARAGMDVYEWLDDTPRTTLVVMLVDRLHEDGWKIEKQSA